MEEIWSVRFNKSAEKKSLKKESQPHTKTVLFSVLLRRSSVFPFNVLASGVMRE